MTVYEMIFTTIMSIGIGLFMGVIGGGGGGIYVVVLMILFNQSAKTAAVTALVLSTITLSGAALEYWRKKQLRIDYFIVLSILDIIGTLLGNLIMNHISENVLKIVMVCILVLSGLSSLMKIKAPEPNDNETAKVFKKLPVTIPIGLASGLMTGTTGMSGSTMLSSYLIGALNFSPYLAVGTSTLVNFAGNFLSIAVLCMNSLVFHVSTIHINVEILLTFGIGSAVGAVFGAKLTTKINRKVLTFVLAAIAIIPGIYLALK